MEAFIFRYEGCRFDLLLAAMAFLNHMPNAPTSIIMEPLYKVSVVEIL